MMEEDNSSLCSDGSPPPSRAAAPEINFSPLSPLSCFWLGEKPGNELEEVKLQNASKQIVQNAILQAVQQVSQESLRRDRPRDSRPRGQLGGRELTKKHEKK
ncbi:A-kinase anchor protein inhibitor 1 [Peromyscus leucopus]|uniref:A-kinase anchor protein inhibitor 1 n=1 Tax=Peromyscus leucopus TaxID=10041 RepID=UPI00188521A3|nr:A-kinase anchor protein inhibitor 1 [Peromyscus leucopus]